MAPRRIMGMGAAAGITLLAAAVGFGTEGGLGGPLPGLTEPQGELFRVGKADFEEVEAAAEGLGPFFNGFGCAECHAHPATGGVAPPDRPELREMRIGRRGPHGEFDPMVEHGGPVFHRLGLGDLPESELEKLPAACRQVRGGTRPPDEAQFVSFRIPTPVFGAGLMEAIPAREILRRADPDDARRRDGITGRPNMLGSDVGRFGWKAQHATLVAFAADAYRTEMGITNPLAPTEAHATRRGPMGDAAARCDTVPEFEDAGEGAVNFANFMRLLAPLPRGPITAEVRRGERLFQRAGCHLCHVPEMSTGPNPIAALDRKPVPLFSDLLLHDLGHELADGIVQGGAGGREFRTAPLWGLRFRPAFLHDGRTDDLLEVIRLHQGEAARASDRVLHRFTPGEREDLLAFLRSL